MWKNESTDRWQTSAGADYINDSFILNARDYCKTVDSCEQESTTQDITTKREEEKERR